MSRFKGIFISIAIALVFFLVPYAFISTVVHADTDQGNPADNNDAAQTDASAAASASASAQGATVDAATAAANAIANGASPQALQGAISVLQGALSALQGSPVNINVNPTIDSITGTVTVNIDITVGTASHSATAQAGGSAGGVSIGNEHENERGGGGGACIPNGSCSAPQPSCGQVTVGTDNCGNQCSLTGQACPPPGGGGNGGGGGTGGGGGGTSSGGGGASCSGAYAICGFCGGPCGSGPTLECGGQCAICPVCVARGAGGGGGGGFVPPPPPPPPPSCNVALDAASIPRGGSARLSWSTNGTSALGYCVSGDCTKDWNPSSPAGDYKSVPTGSQTVSPTQTATYRLSCFASGAGGTSQSNQDVTLIVQQVKWREIIPILPPSSFLEFFLAKASR